MKNSIFNIFYIVLLSVPFTFVFGNDNEKISLEDLEQLGKNIEASIENGNPMYLNICFDQEAFLEKLSLRDNAYTEGFVSGFNEYFDLGAVLVEETNNSADYKFHSAYFSDGNPRIMFRLLTNSGINYHEFEIRKINDKLRIEDAYIFLSAERLSDMVKRIYIINMDREYCNPEEQRMQAAYRDMEMIRETMLSGKFGKAYKKWNKLSPEYKSLTAFQTLGIQLATYTNEESYFRHYKKFMKDCTDTKGKYLIPITGLSSFGYYSETLACIDSLDKAVGTDPMLNIFRANIYYSINEYETAAEYFARIISTYPEYEFTYFNLLSIYIQEKQYEKATSLLEVMTFTFNHYKEDFHEILAEYPEFIESDEYRMWLSR